MDNNEATRRGAVQNQTLQERQAVRVAAGVDASRMNTTDPTRSPSAAGAERERAQQREASLRNQALHYAIEHSSEGCESKNVVAHAEAFLAFLKGGNHHP